VRRIERILLFDVAATAAPRDGRIQAMAGDLADPAALDRALEDAASVFHLAAVVSGQAEADFDLGMRVNLDGTRALLQACRALPEPVRLVFSSSVAVFGGTLPAVVPDDFAATPQTSYGCEKAIGELLVADYSRKGFLDGRSVRLPTVVVRPGKPNRAASSFASGIIREPLNGVETVCPVDPATRLWISSPATVVENLIRAHELPAQAWSNYPTLNLPGLTITVREMVDGLGRVAGQAPVDRIRWQVDPLIASIVKTWPGDFRTDRARALGFIGDTEFDTAFVRAYMADEGLAS
jgi:nucleoside-diphosphate-sugar epimerase